MIDPNFFTQPPLPDEPTDAAPGSIEKIEIMRERYLSGCHIHHPDDAKDARFRARAGRMQAEGILTDEEDDAVKAMRALGLPARVIREKLKLKHRDLERALREID